MTYDWRPPGPAQVRAPPRVTHTLFYYDGPKMVLALDEHDCQMIGVAADDDDDDDTTRWLFVSAKPDDVLELIEKKVSIGRLFSSSDQVEVWDIDHSWTARRSYAVSYDDVPSHLVPTSDAGLPDLASDARRELIEHQRELWSTQGMLAGAKLFFSGNPVHGTRAMAASFAGDAISSYQFLVSMVYSAKHTELSQTGPIPAKLQSSLYVTSMPRGSVGFELIELNPQSAQNRTLPSRLCETVTDVHELLSAAAHSDESYAYAISSLGIRVNKAVEGFLSTLRKNEATLRIESRMQRYELDKTAIDNALERVSHDPPSEETRRVDGMLIGLLPVDLRFELRTTVDGRVLKGKIDRGADIEKIGSFMLRQEPGTAILHVVRIHQSEAFVLLDVEEVRA